MQKWPAALGRVPTIQSKIEKLFRELHVQGVVKIKQLKDVPVIYLK